MVDSRIMVCAPVPKAESAKLFDFPAPCWSCSGWSLLSSEGRWGPWLWWISRRVSQMAARAVRSMEEER